MSSRSILLRSLTSRIKGDDTYRSGVKVGDRLFCTIEPSAAITQFSKIRKR